ncbi:MAG: pilus motility taxis protein HmpF [Elainellaceae cyanobacterium]
MLYLAEVQKKTRVLGSGKAEFKLLACQRSEYSWTAVSEDIIPAPDDVPYSSGALVLVDLSGNRQIQRHSEAGRQLVSILQNFSRLQEKSKTQEDEIEQWKQSLTYQSQELNRREIEMETRQAELEQMEEDFERLEQQRQEVEAARAEVDQTQAEFERKSQELEGAWAQLNGERRRLDERQSDLQASDPEQVAQLRQALERLSSLGELSATAPELLPATLIQYADSLEQQQQQLAQHWQTFEAQRSALNEQQAAVESQAQQIQERWQGWHEANAAWQQGASDLAAQQAVLAVKRDTLQLVSSAAQQQSDLMQQLREAPGMAQSLEDKIDLSALEEMPIEALQDKVRELERDFQKSSQFVSSQEEELLLQQQAIDELETKVAQASEYDRLQLETQLTDEKESYQMLNRTLVGQRRNLQERELLLKRHRAVLAQRQGQPLEEDAEADANLALTQAETVYGTLSQRADALQSEIDALAGELGERETSIHERRSALDDELNQLKQAESALDRDRAAVAETEGQVRLYESVLQPVQDLFDDLRSRMPSMSAAAERLQNAQAERAQAVADLRDTVNQMDGDPSRQLAAS